MRYEANWRFTSGLSAGGSPFFHVQVKDFQSGESTAAFFERHRGELLQAAPDYTLFEPGLIKGETVDSRNYVHTEYLWQPKPDDCVYHVVEHVFRSSYYPVKDFGFIVSAGLCELDITAHGQNREHTLRSFEEYN